MLFLLCFESMLGRQLQSLPDQADFTSVPISWFNGTNPKSTLAGTGTTSLGAKGLGFSAMPYSEWASDPEPFFADHEKAKLQLNAQPFIDQHLYIEVEFGGRILGTKGNPFPIGKVHEDDLWNLVDKELS